MADNFDLFAKQSPETLQMWAAQETDPAAKKMIADAIDAKVRAGSGTSATQVRQGSSNSTSSSTTTRIPGVDRATLEASKDQALSTQADLLAQMREAITGMKTAGETVAQQQEAAGSLGAAATVAQGNQQAAGVESKAAVSKAVGADLNPGSPLVEAIAGRQDAWRAMDPLRAEIERAQQVNPLEDPVGFLVNMVRVPLLKRTYNTVADRASMYDQRIAQIDNTALQQQAINAEIPADTIRQTAAAKAAADAAAAYAKANETRMQTAHISAQGIMQQMAASGNAFEYNMKLAGMWAETYKYGLVNAASEKEAAKQAKLAPTVQAWNVKRAAMGLAPMEIEEFAQLSAAEKSRITQLAQVPGLGAHPGQAFETIISTGGINTLPQANPSLYKFLQDRMASPQVDKALQTLRQEPSFLKKPLEEQQAAALQRAENDEWLMLKKDQDHSKLPPESPYAFNRLQAATNPALKDNWVTKSITDMVAKDPSHVATGISDRRLLDEYLGRVTEATRAGDAASVRRLSQELADFYRVGQQEQFSKSGAAAMGYHAPDGYGVRGYLTAGTTDKGIQMWAPVELEHWAVANMRKNAANALPVFGRPVIMN